jgi:hypothetical protein
VIGAEAIEVEDWEQALSASDEGDYFVSKDARFADARLEAVRTVGEHTLYRRVAPCDRLQRTDCSKD